MLVGPFSLNNMLPARHEEHAQKAEAAILPLMIRDRFTAKQMAGDAVSGSQFLKINEEFLDPENHCEFCTRVEYVPGPEGVAGFSYEDLIGLDLSGAKRASFWVMGEEGGEKIKFKLAGKSLDKIEDKPGKLKSKLTKSIFKSERFALTTEEVTLGDDWKKYEVDLSDVDLEEITHPFAFELSKNGVEKQVLYIKGVIYDDEPAADPLATIEEEFIEPLKAEIISNNTEGIAPTTFEFEANITGGIEPYSINWDFDDGGKSNDKTVSHTFDRAGTYNITLDVTDAGDQTASDSFEIQVEEPKELEVVPEERTEEPSSNETFTDNSTATNSTQ